MTYWADTTGVGRRIPLREAWRYRDYVIRAFNEDKPYDRFIREQIAGPEDKASGIARDAQAATGFLVIGPWAWFSYDRAQLRVDVADLQVDLVGRTFLGLTVGCARCHDHKFDPITNRDYFAMSGIFLSTNTLSSRNGDGGINLVRIPETLEEAAAVRHRCGGMGTRVAETEAAEKVNTRRSGRRFRKPSQLSNTRQAPRRKRTSRRWKRSLRQSESGVAWQVTASCFHLLST